MDEYLNVIQKGVCFALNIKTHPFYEPRAPSRSSLSSHSLCLQIRRYWWLEQEEVLRIILCFTNRRTLMTMMINDDILDVKIHVREYTAFFSWLYIVCMGWRCRVFHSDSSACFRRPQADLKKYKLPRSPPSFMSQCPVTSLEGFP